MYKNFRNVFMSLNLNIHKQTIFGQDTVCVLLYKVATNRSIDTTLFIQKLLHMIQSWLWLILLNSSVTEVYKQREGIQGLSGSQTFRNPSLW